SSAPLSPPPRRPGCRSDARGRRRPRRSPQRLRPGSTSCCSETTRASSAPPRVPRCSPAPTCDTPEEFGHGEQMMSETTGRQLEGKVVLVVGASAGIGADAVRLFAREGARLVLAARRREPLQRLEEEIAQAGGEVVAVTGDVAVAADAEGFVETALDRYGRLDGAFNNAGMNQYGRLDDVSEEEFDRIMAVNVKGTWLCLRAQLRAMRPAGAGSIVNTSSIGGFRGSTGLGAYQATKHAVIGMTRTAAHDNGP